MIRKLIDFFKSPNYNIDKDLELNQKFTMTLKLVMLALLISLSLGMIIGLIEHLTDIELGRHALDGLFDEYSPGFIFLVVVILAPLLEELIFRGPMYFFRKSRYFGIAFYFLTLAFAFYHITNFEITPQILYLSPLLVAPQLIIGLLLGFIRVRLGLGWAMLLHSLYNLFIIGPIILLKLADVSPSLDVPLS